MHSGGKQPDYFFYHEMLDMEQHYDIAVIDEAQMIADRDRGHSWTRAILGVKADEIHICMSPAAEEVVTHLIALCEDTFEVRHYKRKTALVCEQEAFVFRMMSQKVMH